MKLSFCLYIIPCLLPQQSISSLHNFFSLPLTAFSMALFAEYKARPENKPYSDSEHELCSIHFVGVPNSFPPPAIFFVPKGKTTTTPKRAHAGNQQPLSQRPNNKCHMTQDATRRVATQLRCHTQNFSSYYNIPRKNQSSNSRGVERMSI